MNNLSARNLVSRMLPQRSVASRFLPQRSIVSRNLAPGCNCKNLLSELSDSYQWDDLFDQVFTIKKATKVYQLPNLNSDVVRILQPGDQFQLFSYVNNGGITWLQYFQPPFMYPDYIPLQGAPGSINTIPVDTINSLISPKNDIPGIMTTEEQAQQNENFFDKAENVIAAAVFGIGALILLSKLR